MLNLNNITIVCATSVRIDESIHALQESAKHGNFADVKLITHTSDGELPHAPEGIKVEQCDKLTYKGYSKFIIYDLYKHIDSEFALIINWDGFIINPDKWDSEFLEYDYIGALWTKDHSYKDINGRDIFVGNGGFSLRSKELLELPTRVDIPWEPREGKYWQEDALVSVKNRHIYEEAGLTWAPKRVAAKFSQEFHNEEIEENKDVTPFGFHGKVALDRFTNWNKKDYYKAKL
jgi:hypothetical protein|tara:strand:- start:352 stop:1050 length:699 start_codon:yes stop_codon:yes gene_type:complete